MCYFKTFQFFSPWEKPPNHTLGSHLILILEFDICLEIDINDDLEPATLLARSSNKNLENHTHNTHGLTNEIY
jgi:hypothetical protein